MIGIMLKTVELLGTQLKLPRGILVDLTPATNIPNSEGMMFARPVAGWRDIIGFDVSEDDSILLDPDDYEAYNG